VTEPLCILIVGGYGVFGGRIVQLLENEPHLSLIVAGRSAERATRYCASRGATAAQLLPAAFDRSADAGAQLAALRPDILVDASGPFQAYGGARYSLVEAAIAQCVNYLDLADSSDFVAGIRAFDERARRAGVFVLSGVSSFPVLTAAAVRRLSASLTWVDEIIGGIAPSPFAGVGENVIRAIASYAGQPVAIRRGGRNTRAYPFTEQMRLTVAPPGQVPLRRTLFSLVDVPDLRALAELWPEAGTIWMGAAPMPEALHRALIALAWLVRLRLLPSLSPLAPLMHWATNRLRWGEPRGGMFVAVRGRDAAGASLTRSWHLLADGDDGPLIPSMAVEALVRNALDGRMPAAGARAAVRELELEDYEKLFAERAIHAGMREDALSEPASLYRRLLGAAWDKLPREIRRMHNGVTAAAGEASVERGGSWLGNAAAGIMGFPKAASRIPVHVEFRIAGGEEIWIRSFGEKSFASRQVAGRGASEHLLCERFGPLTFAMALILHDGRLALVPRRWSAFGVPLPMRLCPRANAYERSEDGRFRFHVEIGHPLTGLIVRYRGWLEPEAGASE
jgi:hypothetical protein